MNRTTLIALNALLVALTGCQKPPEQIEDVLFDPRGSAGSLEARWTINELSAGAAACAAAGIENIEVTVYREEDVDYEDGYVVATVPCAGGRHDTGAVLAAGRYLVSVDAMDADGVLLGSHSSEAVVDLSGGGTAVLERADFTTITSLSILLSWDTDPSSAAEVDGACEEAAVTSFSYVLRDASGTEIEAFADLECEDALFFEDIPAGTYGLDVLGKDSAGVDHWAATCADITVADGAYVETTCTVTDASGG